ncbi:hypothetical protein PQR72_37045 [Paraburkholderia madseniana]|nr:hypothetical protein [Paraburkholderia madseniana]NPT69556.1 hypothetical protein [Paraburkholderia madseniana]
MSTKRRRGRGYAWMSRDHDFEHRVANFLAGLGCSLVVIGFDLALQYSL